MIPLSVVDTFATSQPAEIAIVDDIGTVTWSQFRDLVRTTSDAIARRLDPERANRAVLIGDNRAGYVVAASALSTLGIPWVGLDSLGAPALLADQLNSVAPTIVVCTPTALAEFSTILSELPQPPVVAGFPSETAELPAGIATLDVLPADPARVTEWTKPAFLALGFTSGTTGSPKLVLRTNPSEQRRMETFVARYGFNASDTHLVTVPFSHASGHGWARLFLAVGAKVVLTADPSPERLVQLATDHQVRTSLMVPPVLSQFVAAADARPEADLGALRFLLTGGRPFHPREARRAARRLGPVVTTYYGTTETGVNLVADSPELAAKPGTSGRPLPGNHVLILDADHVPVRDGQRGRVALASYMAMTGYANAGSEFVTHDEHEYLVTADFGYLDAHGCLTLISRSDGLPGQELVPANIIEADLLEIDGVEDAAVVRTHEVGQSPVVHGAISLLPDADADLVVKHAEHVLSYYLPDEDPRSVSILPRIPYSRTGKVRTDLVRESVAGATAGTVAARP